MRIYVEMKGYETSGQEMNQIRGAIAEKIGPEAANNMIDAALTFEIKHIRLLADFGQGGEKSV